ncbi:altronate dehydratase family protein [Halanaerocella petrolearia]
MKANLLKINPKDNIGISLSKINNEETINLDTFEFKAQDDIPVGHKIALADIKQGAEIIRYGSPIGIATEDIEQGDWVHTHNLKTGLEGKLDYEYNPQDKSLVEIDNNSVPHFLGYKRTNGKVGIRNEVWIINTVGCINQPVEKLTSLAEDKYSTEIEVGRIDGIHSFTHPYGCSQLGDDLENTQQILAGLVNHPNAAGVLVVGLGCENNLISDFKEFIGNYNEDRVRFMNFQDVEDEMKTGMDLIDELVEYAKDFAPIEIPVSKLKIGLKCGGSDSFSGITANPLVGRISDRLVACGGTTILTEVPEMFGAETILMNRAQDEDTFNKVVDLINGFKDYFLANGQEIYENPSPGNKKGGITTLEEKSLGCTQKGGTGLVRDVFFYGEEVTEEGLNLLESPGNDIVATTALAAAGAHLTLFTTGRGTPLGSPVPTVKISTNSDLYQKKKNWIDYNAGQLIEGIGIDELADQFFDYIIDVASKQKKTKNEENDYREIAIFKTGVTL